MSGIWDAADMLIAMAGDTNAATALAREMADDCAAAKRRRESAYWQSVAWALSWRANPQPLIPPGAPPAPAAVAALFADREGRGAAMPRASGGAAHRLDFAAKLPHKRPGVASLKRRLCEAFERHRAGPPRPLGHESSPKGSA